MTTATRNRKGPTMAVTFDLLILSHFTELCRRDGFLGDVKVSHIRRNRAGWSCRVVTTWRGHTRTYRGTIAGGKVRMTATGPVRRVS